MKIIRLMTVMMISAALTGCGSKESYSSVQLTEIEENKETATEAHTEAETESETESVYEDNFAVETSEAMAFAGKIKAAVAAKDIEALADLTAFPVYVSMAEGGVETRDDFIALGSERIFTPALMESVSGADISNLSPSMAGFSISKDGKANIIFGVAEGRLAIRGFNGGKEAEQAAEKESEIETATLEEISELLGKSDHQAAELFGDGKENWTEDKGVYIGRSYQVNLFDEEVSVYTTYDDKQLVNSVSIWLVNGERKVYEEDAMLWVERLNQFTGTKPEFNDTASEAESKNWKWFLGERAISLNWVEDMLTISMNVVVGELD